ncbi:hypothetical protein RIF29_10965 [Crotalaria pallida]|uniref:Uncharacterized protein n=1 Tax=Crotalaria pallida TaxID=3830 RepID=A0AAN9FZE1_CROPI
MRDRPPLPSSSFVPSSFRQPSALHPPDSLSIPSSSRVCFFRKLSISTLPLPLSPPPAPISTSRKPLSLYLSLKIRVLRFVLIGLHIECEDLVLNFGVNEAEAILLGFQNYLVMLGTTVLIPTYLVGNMGGGKEEKAKMIQTLLFVAGINTLFQTLLRTRLPAVIEGSYTFVPPTISIILVGRYSDIADPLEVISSLTLLCYPGYVTTMLIYFCDTLIKYAKICEDNAWNARSHDCCFNPSNCAWLQWLLAQYSEAV